MGMIIECACGAAIRGISEQELLAGARSHIRHQHPELGEPPSDADLLAMAADEPVQPSHSRTGRQPARALSQSEVSIDLKQQKGD
jgi:hypothetical protein